MKKRCPGCAGDKALSEFGKCASNRDGLMSKCKQCSNAELRASVAKRRAMDPTGEAVKQRARYLRYYAKHKKRVAAQARANRRPLTEEQKKKVREGRSRRYKANPEHYRRKRAEADKRRREKDPENYHARKRGQKQRRHLRHPEKKRARNLIDIGRRRARKANVEVGKVDFDRIRARDRMVCHICKRKVRAKELHFDHVIPLAAGGAHVESNIAVSHSTCNVRKCAKVLTLF